MNNKKTHFYIKLYCPRTSLLFQENLKQSKYNLTSKSTKRTFKKEKIKIKESLYNFVRNTKKNQVKNEERTINRNKNKINKYISILNDANIDEGIVLNKYFAYVKRYNIEYEKSQKLKLEGELNYFSLKIYLKIFNYFVNKYILIAIFYIYKIL